MHLAAIRVSQLDVLSLTPLSKETDSEIRDDGSWNGNRKERATRSLAFAPESSSPCTTTSTVITPCHNTPVLW